MFFDVGSSGTVRAAIFCCPETLRHLFQRSFFESLVCVTSDYDVCFHVEHGCKAVHSSNKLRGSTIEHSFDCVYNSLLLLFRLPCRQLTRPTCLHHHVHPQKIQKSLLSQVNDRVLMHWIWSVLCCIRSKGPVCVVSFVQLCFVML